MDLVDTLKKKINVLEEGDHIPGLKAVLLHIETAFRHLARGQDYDDDTAFTDAIYRTNQAFEGSIKEAYRVLAGYDPAKKRPYDIEIYLEKNSVFRGRVLNQLTTYRTEWRNPSAHDYKLDFDESEAFLAIISVSAFACLLLDQIAESLAYAKAQKQAEAKKGQTAEALALTLDADLLTRVTSLLEQFCKMHMPASSSTNMPASPRTVMETEAQVIGALHGFLAIFSPDLSVLTDAVIGSERRLTVDLIVQRGNERIAIELKRRFIRMRHEAAIAQVQRYLQVGGFKQAVLLYVPDGPGEMERLDYIAENSGESIVVLAPHGSNLTRSTN